jgi:hypothetical protein
LPYWHIEHGCERVAVLIVEPEDAAEHVDTLALPLHVREILGDDQAAVPPRR